MELVGILSRFDVEGLLYAHDRIAELSAIAPASVHDSEGEMEGGAPPESAFISGHSTSHSSGSATTGPHPSSTAHPADKTFKIIRLEKSNEPLVNPSQKIQKGFGMDCDWLLQGATVRNDGESVVVGRIVRGGVAERSGLLHEGDEILEVNGVEVRGKSINDVCDLVGSMSGTITFLIVPATAHSPVVTPPQQPNVVSPRQSHLVAASSTFSSLSPFSVLIQSIHDSMD